MIARVVGNIWCPKVLSVNPQSHPHHQNSCLPRHHHHTLGDDRRSHHRRNLPHHRIRREAPWGRHRRNLLRRILHPQNCCFFFDQRECMWLGILTRITMRLGPTPEGTVQAGFVPSTPGGRLGFSVQLHWVFFCLGFAVFACYWVA